MSGKRKLIISGREIGAVSVLPEDSPAPRFAAGQLKSYLEKSGISVTADAFPVILSTDPGIGRDGYRIEAGEDSLRICGGNGRGVCYGVFALLERCARARFFTPDLETSGDGDIVINESFSFTPVFEYRQSDWQCGNDLTWSLKNGINSRPLPEEMGGNIRYGGFVHTLGRLCGVPAGEQPCLCDPAMLEKAKAGVRKILENDPGCTIISVSQNDNKNYCRCPACAASDEEEGSPAGTLLRFVNAIAADVEKDYPHVVIDTLAYQYTRKPPRITRPRKNVCVRLCSIECCFSHPLSDPTCERNRPFIEDIEGWNKICDRIYIWDYVTNFHHYLPTFPNLSVLRENMRFFADHHVRGMYPEGQFNSPASGEFGELKAYLLAKLMWDPYMSAVEYDRRIDEFLEAYYGNGWRFIRAYIDLCESFTRGRHMGIYGNPYAYFDKEKVLALEPYLDSLWDSAEELAADRADFVRRSRLQWRWLKLELHPDAKAGKAFFDECEARRVKFSESRTVFPDRTDFATPPSGWAVRG